MAEARQPTPMRSLALPLSVQSRLATLEDSALEVEGALFGHRDLLARLLAQLPDSEARKTILDLIAEGEAHAEELGERRLAGYRDELNAVQEEMGHARTATPGLLARLSRSR
jgi:hypothetical protein